jgi:hypothetical protein
LPLCAFITLELTVIIDGLFITNLLLGRLGGVVVSVLVTGPKGRGFKTGRGDGFLRAIKIRSTPSIGC